MSTSGPPPAPPTPRTTLDAAQLKENLEQAKGHYLLEACDVSGELDLFGAALPVDAAFAGCTFSVIHAEYAAFSGVVRFASCRIERLSVRGARFERDVSLTDCDVGVLEGPAHAAALSIQRSRIGELSAPQAAVDADLVLDGSAFGRVNLRAARIGGDLRLDGFSAQSFNGDALSALAVSAQSRASIGDAHFVSADLRTGFLLEGAEIAALTLNGLSVTGPLDMRGSRFGTLEMIGAKTGTLTLTGCRVEQCLKITHAHVGPVAITGSFAAFRFEDNEVDGLLQIAFARFAGDLVLQRNKIDVLAVNAPWRPGVEPIVVAGMANLFGNTVTSQILISHLEVGGELRLTDTHVPELIADNLTVGGDLDATMSRIDGGLVISAATVKGDITLAAMHAGTKTGLVACTAQTADLSGLSADGDLEIDVCTFNVLRMVHARVGGSLSFGGTKVKRELNLTGTASSELRFDDELVERAPASAFAFPPSVLLRGCKYETLDVAVPNFIDALAAQPSADGGAYASLQAYLRGLGMHEAADATIVSWRRQAKRQIPWRSARRWGSELLDLFSAYGTQPWRLLLTVAILLAIVFAVCSLPGAVVAAAGATPPPDATALDRLRLTLAVALGGSAATSGGYVLSSAPAILGLFSANEIAGLFRDVAIALVAIVTAYVTGLLKYPEDR